MLIPDPRRTPLPNLISHNGVILYQWEFLRDRLDEGEGLPWIAMDCWWRWLPLVAPTDTYPPKAAAPKHRQGRTCNGYHGTYSSMQARTGNTHQSTMLYDV